MNEDELKALVGDAAFGAMSAEQRTAAIGKFTPAPPAPPKGAKPPVEPPEPEDDDEEEDLLKKARKTGKNAGDEKGRMKAMEEAIGWNMKSKDFIKAHAAILPPEAAALLDQADKETYDSAAEKAAQIKSGLIQSFFDIQSNVDLLTSGQKAQLDEFRALTKNGKLDRAPNIYEMIFEPAFERLKDSKKAEALNRGHHTEGSVEGAYKKRIHENSMKRYRMEKNQ